MSWETSSDRLRAYFENFGVVREAFVSYNRNNGRPRGFGFVVFESVEVADKVVSTKHTIDRREVGKIERHSSTLSYTPHTARTHTHFLSLSV